MKVNQTHFTLKALIIASIGILSASAPISTRISAMEAPSTICRTCGQQKPQLNLSYLAVRAERCTACRAILLPKPIEGSDTTAQIKAEFSARIQALENQSVNQQQLQELQATFEARFKALESRLAQTEAYIAEQQKNNRSPWIERGSLLLGSIAGAIAYGRKFSAHQSALIGLGTAATSYAVAKLVLRK